MAQLKKFQTVPYLKKIIWQPYNDNNQPEKSMEFEPECAVILSTDAWEELADLKAKPDCTGCVRAKGANPVNVNNGTCFECSRPDWCDRDFYEAKGE